jgi:hypothetical protein
MVSVDAFVNNPSFAPRMVDGNAITKETAALASQIGQAIQNDPTFTSTLQGQQFIMKIQNGLSMDDINNILMGNGPLAEVFAPIFRNAVRKTGIEDWGNQAATEAALEYAKQGVYAALGRPTTQLVNNKQFDINSQMELERYRQALDLQTAAAKAGLNSSGGAGGNYGAVDIRGYTNVDKGISDIDDDIKEIEEAVKNPEGHASLSFGKQLKYGSKNILNKYLIPKILSKYDIPKDTYGPYKGEINPNKVKTYLETEKKALGITRQVYFPQLKDIETLRTVLATRAQADAAFGGKRSITAITDEKGEPIKANKLVSLLNENAVIGYIPEYGLTLLVNGKKYKIDPSFLGADFEAAYSSLNTDIQNDIAEARKLQKEAVLAETEYDRAIINQNALDLLHSAGVSAYDYTQNIWNWTQKNVPEQSSSRQTFK